MLNYKRLYIDGTWVEPSGKGDRELIDPFTEQPFARVTMGADGHDVDKAVLAARAAFQTFSRTSVVERARLIDRIIEVYERRLDELSSLIAQEVGIPVAARAQVTGPADHMRVARDLVASYQFERRLGDTIIRREPIGVCALVSPWNWPLQTPVIKAIYGIAAGCTMILKPSDASAISAIVLAEIFHEAGVPAGVFNLVLGAGREIGAALAAHPGIDMISFTGSTKVGAKVGEMAARTIKRTSLELGGKSANVVLPDADLEKAARWNIQRCFFNSGQSCHAPSRMLVHESQIATVVPYLVDEASRFRLGDPRDPSTSMGPVVHRTQFESIQAHIRSGIEEGAVLACGGLDRPSDRNQGYFVRPTVFTGVDPLMRVSVEEIFGPVLAVIPYRDEDEAVRIANDSPFGLGAYVFAGDRSKGYEFASNLRAGRVSFNGAATNSVSPMGGYKQSGIGRSMGVFGLEEYLEVKSVYGFAPEAAALPELLG